MIAKMSKIEVIGPKQHIEETLDKIHLFGKVQIAKLEIEKTLSEELTSIGAKPYTPDDSEIRLKEQMENLCRKADGIVALLEETADTLGISLPPVEKEYHPYVVTDKFVRDLGIQTEKIEHKMQGLLKKRAEMTHSLHLAKKFENIIDLFTPLVKKLAMSESIEIYGFTIKKREMYLIPIIRQEIDIITKGSFELFTDKLDVHTMAAVVAFPAHFLTDIKHFFVGENITELAMPQEYSVLP